MLTFRRLVALGALFSTAVFLPACTASSDAGCPDDLEFFRTQMWEPTMSTQCIACHSASGAAKGTRMVLLSPDEPGALEENFMTVRAMAREKVDGTSLLLLKPTGLHPAGHGGGKLVAQTSTLYTNFQRFADRVNGTPGACEGSLQQMACTPEGLDPTARRQLRMLTRFEYDNTLKDLLYLDTESKWGQALPAEEVVHGFDNTADARAVGQLLTDKLLTASEQAAAAAVAKLSRHVSCAPGEACARTYIQDFGARAFRAPLAAEDLSRYQTLYASVASEDGYLKGLEAVTTAMLLSPHFLYRSELGQHQGNGRYVLSDYELASELSYLFWGSMPDADLFAKAKAGQLHTPEQLAAEARRMLASPRSRPMLDHFVSQWLDLEKLAQTPKDPSLFADFTPAVRAAMKEETLSLFNAVVRQEGGGHLADLFTAEYTYASDTLAAFYRLPSSLAGSTVSTGSRRWELTGTGRGGILSHGSILATQATAQVASPVRRGRLVRERLLCQPLPPAPPGLNLELPTVDPGMPNRERFSEHSSNPSCSACHKMMDPIGFGFEQFNSVGRFEPKLANGAQVDASGEILASPSTQGTFTGVEELQDKLADSPDVQQCFSLQWLRFGYGVSGDDSTCAATQLSERFRQSATSIPELLVSLTQLPRFTQRWGAVAAMPAPPPPTGTIPVPTPPETIPGTGGQTPQPPTMGGVQVSTKVQDDWGGGYCHNVKVTNTSSSETNWRISLQVEGTIFNAWNATYKLTGAGVVEFTGVDWNGRLSPGNSASFGFCASR
ncbi:DUF1592 domain-containing protein [Melittangium boletus]|uniref:DUF1592 domain-containing protein n=1 Tax=Melittangium boletus TaxID=83453 RepID=UPI003DA49C21